MPPMNQDGAAAPISAALLAEIEKGLRPIRKDEATIYRGNERRPIFSVRSPAYGYASVKAAILIGDCAVANNLESRAPEALQALGSTVPGYVIFRPVEIYDPNQKDQYPLSWRKGNRVVSVNLLEILQPRNLEVPKGYVAEMPVSIETLPSGGTYVFLHTGESVIRVERANEEEELNRESVDEVAAAEEPAE